MIPHCVSGGVFSSRIDNNWSLWGHDQRGSRELGFLWVGWLKSCITKWKSSEILWIISLEGFALNIVVFMKSRLREVNISQISLFFITCTQITPYLRKKVHMHTVLGSACTCKNGCGWLFIFSWKHFLYISFPYLGFGLVEHGQHCLAKSYGV